MVILLVEGGKLSRLDEAFWRGWLAANHNLSCEAILAVLKKHYPFSDDEACQVEEISVKQ
jgi:hypothetical protein